MTEPHTSDSLQRWAIAYIENMAAGRAMARTFSTMFDEQDKARDTVLAAGGQMVVTLLGSGELTVYEHNGALQVRAPQ